MEGLRRADAEVYGATHPGVRVRGRMNRYVKLECHCHYYCKL